MNKSKILKKSLAMILAVMMIVAMIPLGASAADAPVISSVTIRGEAATLSGTTYSAAISSTGIAANNVNVVIQLKNGVGKVMYSGVVVEPYNGQVVIGGNVGITAEAKSIEATELSARSFEFSVWDTSMEHGTNYVVSWTYKAQSSDNSLASIAFEDSTKQFGSAVSDNGTLVVTTTYNGVTPTNDKLIATVNAAATVSGPSSLTIANEGGGKWSILKYPVDGTAFTITVTSENLASKTYSIKVTKPKYFPTFSITGERKDAVVDESTGKITAYLPYDQATVTKSGDTYYEITTNFTTGYPSATVKSVGTTAPNKTSPAAFVSGDKLYIKKASGTDLTVSTGYKLTLVYTYPNATDKSFELTIAVPKKDPKAELSALTIGNYNATISGTTITAELPASYMTGATSVKLKVAASVQSKVELLGTTDKIAAAAGTSEDLKTNFDASKEGTYTIRVTSGWSADEAGAVTPAVTDYTLNVKKVNVNETASLKAFILEDPDGEQYKGTVDSTNNKVTVSVPYSTVRASMENTWVIYYEGSNGSVVTIGDGTDPLVATGDKINDKALKLIPTTFDGKTAAEKELVVTASNNSSKKYKVYVSKLAAETGTSITSFGVTAKTKYEDLTDTNVFSVKPSGTTITINVPYSDYATADFGNSTSTVVPVFELSKGAKVYELYTDGKGYALTGVTESAEGKKTKTGGNAFDGTGTTPKTLTLIVTSEAATSLEGQLFNDAWKGNNAGKFQTYKLSVKQQAARTTYAFAEVSLFNDRTLETVKGTVSGTTITFSNIPYHFIADSAANNVFFNYKVNNGEGVATNNTGAYGTKIPALAFEDNGHLTTASAAAGKKVAITANAGDLTQVYIESEDGKAGTATPSGKAVMNIAYTTLDAEKGAAMTSMTINNVTARPDSTNKIAITLPYGTEITALKPTWVVSKYATVTYDGAPVNSGELTLNFTADQSFVVTSEDKATTATYTVSVTTADQFSDVPANAWYAADVLEAARKGIVAGVGNGRFNPSGKVTREQFAQYIARMDGYTAEDWKNVNKFSDVTTGTEAAAAIAYCADKGYISGKGDTTFDSKGNITRQDMAVVLCKVLGLTPVTEPKAKFADDASISGYAKPYVYACYEAGKLSGVGNNTFNPKGLTTRAQAASVVVRVSKSK